jgi:hypothetical protein
VASLLLYGSMHGACSVAVGPRREVVTNNEPPKIEVKPTETTKNVVDTYPKEDSKEQEKHDDDEQRGQQKKAQQTGIGGTITVDPNANKQENKTESEDIFDTGTTTTTKKNGVFGWLKKQINNIEGTFSGKDEEDF